MIFESAYHTSNSSVSCFSAMPYPPFSSCFWVRSLAFSLALALTIVNVEIIASFQGVELL